MTTHADGTGECDRCGKLLPNTGGGYCVAVVGLKEDGKVWAGHWCTSGEMPCAGLLIDEEAVAHAVSSGGQVPQFFNQFPPIQEPADEPEPEPEPDVLVPPGDG
jgi:hypothetical protein